MPNVGLGVSRQDDFSAGMFRSVARHLVPRNGVYDHVNGLHDDDGAVYRRAGCEYQSAGGLGSTGLRWMWDGILSPGARTLVASSAKWGVLDSDDSTLIDLGAGGLSGPTRAVKVGDLLFVGGGTIYGGSRKTGDYSTGTVTTTLGSKTVTGSGTSWTANVDAGMLLRISGERVYVVASVDGNTQVTLTEPYQGVTGSGKAYTLKRFETASSPYVSAEIYGTIFDRLLIGSGSRLRFTAGVQDTAPYTQPHSLTATDEHAFSGELLGVAALRDVVFVFTTDGVHVVMGMAFDMLDPSGTNFQQRQEHVTRDVVLWAKEGIASAGNSLIVPGVDGVYRLGVSSAPELLSRSIAPLYSDHVRAGRKPGQAAVYRGHYVLPILAADNSVVETLVCRIDRPVKSPVGTAYPWSRWSGLAGNVTALALRVGGASASRSPNLLAASRADGSRVLKLGGCWEPAAARKADADGTVARWVLETRDVATGTGNLNHVRRCRLGYELVDGGSDDPVIVGFYSKGAEANGVPHWDEVDWDEFSWADEALVEFVQLQGQAPEDTGRNPFTWLLTARTRFIRWRFECSDPCASLRVRSIDAFIRQSGRDR